ncbi:hypothetical protein Goari_003065, partial [Gossypium aridum]|nr:hypothetical protein [Gossypium aridum]
MDPKKHIRTDASSSNPSRGARSSFNECFRSKSERERFIKNFASKQVWESRNLDFA